MSPIFHHNGKADRWPDRCTGPRPASDPWQRYVRYGPIQPMDEDRGLLWKLFGRR